VQPGDVVYMSTYGNDASVHMPNGVYDQAGGGVVREGGAPTYSFPSKGGGAAHRRGGQVQPNYDFAGGAYSDGGAVEVLYHRTTSDASPVIYVR
jgi:hypothetical protein